MGSFVYEIGLSPSARPARRRLLWRHSRCFASTRRLAAAFRRFRGGARTLQNVFLLQVWPCKMKCANVVMAWQALDVLQRLWLVSVLLGTSAFLSACQIFLPPTSCLLNVSLLSWFLASRGSIIILHTLEITFNLMSTCDVSRPQITHFCHTILNLLLIFFYLLLQMYKLGRLFFLICCAALMCS